MDIRVPIIVNIPGNSSSPSIHAYTYPIKGVNKKHVYITNEENVFITVILLLY
jgi:hypothetical protein